MISISNGILRSLAEKKGSSCSIEVSNAFNTIKKTGCRYISAHYQKVLSHNFDFHIIHLLLETHW